MSFNRKETYDSSESSSDSESDNEDIQPQTDDQVVPSLSLIDDEQPVLRVPNFEGEYFYVVYNVHDMLFTDAKFFTLFCCSIALLQSTSQMWFWHFNQLVLTLW